MAEPPAAPLPVVAAAEVPLSAPLAVVETEAEPPAAALVVPTGGVVALEPAVAPPVVAVALVALASTILI